MGKPKSHTERAKLAKRESRYIDFKASFDPNSKREWVELTKDFAAMANSGGGAVVIGVANNGRSSGVDLSQVMAIDPAKITDQLASYTEQHFSDFEINEIRRNKAKAVVIEVGSTENLLVFSKPGTYPNPKSPDKQITAFSRGTVYFRHGAKSEPGVNSDIGAFIDRRLDQIRKKWLDDVRRVIAAPPGSELQLIERMAADEEGVPTEIRLTDDPRATVYGKLDPDRTHPHRQKELIKEVNKRLPDNRRINSHDILAVRTVHQIDPERRPEFADSRMFGPTQYSDAFATWLVEKDRAFFEDARKRYYEMKHGSSG
jgi:hypothetical protein